MEVLLMPIDDFTLAPPGTLAVLDDAHIGDITGALGTIRHNDTHARRSWKGRLLALLAIMGPGLIVMVGDNDAGGVATYTQAGQNFGTSLLWTLPLLVPVLIVNQEMVVRLGAVTGVGHARLIFERFGTFWGAFSVGDLFILNFLTIVTEFIGIRLAAAYFGVTPYLVVPLAALALVAMTITGSFRRWERCMYLFIAGNFLAIPLVFLVHPDLAQIGHDTVVPHISGGAVSDAVLLIVAIVGTTVAPWQLFFQQSNVIDKRITPRWLQYERADTVIGSFVVIVGAGALMITAAVAFHHTALAGHFTDAGGVAAGLRLTIGGAAGAIFAVVLLNASIIGASAVTLATAYACGDVFRINHSLHRGVGDAKLFYSVFTCLVALAAGIVLIPDAPLGVITTAVQALAGVLLPSATVFLLLLCNDKEVLGPWANAPWLNALASMIVAVLLMLSAILVVNTLFAAFDVADLVPWLAAALGALLVVLLAATVLAYRRREEVARIHRATWRMPQLALLDRPAWSLSRQVGMLALRGYLVVAVLLLIVKAVELSIVR
ncbi:MAG TPA: NRAMP family divalent metal transporter [Candidatus Dormibacteraeota bacterium]